MGPSSQGPAEIRRLPAQEPDRVEPSGVGTWHVGGKPREYAPNRERDRSARARQLAVREGAPAAGDEPGDPLTPRCPSVGARRRGEVVEQPAERSIDVRVGAVLCDQPVFVVVKGTTSRGELCFRGCTYGTQEDVLVVLTGGYVDRLGKQAARPTACRRISLAGRPTCLAT